MNRARGLFVVVLVATMSVSSFQVFAVAILASDLIEEFGISRGQIGLLISANTILGAGLAPWLGRVTDRVGGRRSVLTLLMITGIGLTTMALATSYAMLVVGSMINGAPQGWANPATNKLIVEGLDKGSRGVVLGVKQSGVQVGVFLAGVTLPLASRTIGWRWGVASYAVLAFGLVVFTALALSPDESRQSRPITVTSQCKRRAAVQPLVITVAAYAALMGIVSGGVTSFTPLFAHEELGYSTTVAGLAAALMGLLGVGTRIWWSRMAEIRSNTVAPLAVMAAGAGLVALMLTVSTTLGSWLLWPVVVLGAFTIAAWNSVAMLRVVNEVDADSAGSATGIVLFGFLGGLAVGSPTIGWSVDHWNTYTPAWTVLIVIAGVAATVIARPGSAGSNRQNLPSGSR